MYEIADSVHDVVVEPGTVVVAEGDEPDALYVLVSGTAEVTGGPPHERRVFRTLDAPDYFGEIGLFRRIPRTATVTALGRCELWRIPGERFLDAAAQAGASGALMDTIQIRFDTTPVPATVS